MGAGATADRSLNRLRMRLTATRAAILGEDEEGPFVPGPGELLRPSSRRATFRSRLADRVLVVMKGRWRCCRM